MDTRITAITLGVKNIKKSREFYESLGFHASSMSNDHFVAFSTSGIVFCLYPTELLAEDAMTEPGFSGFRGITLAHNVATKNEVQHILEEAVNAGAKLIKPAQDVFWGGHSGYFADPDGYLWEIAWNPHWPLSKDGLIQLPE